MKNAAARAAKTLLSLVRRASGNLLTLHRGKKTQQKNNLTIGTPPTKQTLLPSNSKSHDDQHRTAKLNWGNRRERLKANEENSVNKGVKKSGKLEKSVQKF